MRFAGMVEAAGVVLFPQALESVSCSLKKRMKCPQIPSAAFIVHGRIFAGMSGASAAPLRFVHGADLPHHGLRNKALSKLAPTDPIARVSYTAKRNVPL
jgi:hypothetical protein